MISGPSTTLCTVNNDQSHNNIRSPEISWSIMIHPNHFLIELKVCNQPIFRMPILRCCLSPFFKSHWVHSFRPIAARSNGPHSHSTIDLLMANSALDKYASSHHRWPVDAQRCLLLIGGNCFLPYDFLGRWTELFRSSLILLRGEP